MPIPISNIQIQKKQYWRVLGFISSIIGLISYALSSSFIHLFGEWNFIKIIIYTIVSFIIITMMLFMKKWKLSRSSLLKAHMGILVLMLTSLYSFESDKSLNGKKPDLLSLVSCISFAFMSFCLSRQIDLGFEADLLNFFLGCLTVQLMKINLLLSIVAAIFCYCLMLLRSKLDSHSHLEIGTLRNDDHVGIEIIDSVANGSQQNQFLRRRVFDGYNWKIYKEKVEKRSENQRSYYKCTYPDCHVKKKVERNIDGEIVETIYKGTHNHCTRESTMKKNSSSEYLHSLLNSEHGSEQLNSDGESDHSTLSV